MCYTISRKKEAMSEFKNTEMTNTAKTYLSGIAEKLVSHFNLHYNEEKCNEFFDLYAFHQNNFFKSFITRSTVYEGFSVFEHMLFRYVKDFSQENLEQFKETLIKISPSVSNPNKLHKKSTITGIIICENSIPEELKKSVEKFFYRKNYKFCFHGWSETTCVVVSLADKLIYIPKGYKSLQKLFAF